MSCLLYCTWQVNKINCNEANSNASVKALVPKCFDITRQSGPNEASIVWNICYRAKCGHLFYWLFSSWTWLASSSMLFFLYLFGNSISGDKWHRFFYRLDSILVSQPRLLKPCAQPMKINYWHHPFPSYHQTPALLLYANSNACTIMGYH